MLPFASLSRRLFARPTFARLMFALLALLALGASPVHAQTDTAQDAEQQLTDERIVAVVMALNELEIESSRPALEQATNEDVRNYAQKMIDAHNQALETIKQLGVEPQPNEVSQTLRDTAQGVKDKLAQESGGDYDRQYMQMQISLHQNALNLLDYTLIPRTEDAELRQQLIDTRMKVDQHLQNAWELYRNLSGGQGQPGA